MCTAVSVMLSRLVFEAMTKRVRCILPGGRAHVLMLQSHLTTHTFQAAARNLLNTSCKHTTLRSVTHYIILSEYSTGSRSIAPHPNTRGLAVAITDQKDLKYWPAPSIYI